MRLVIPAHPEDCCGAASCWSAHDGTTGSITAGPCDTGRCREGWN